MDLTKVLVGFLVIGFIVVVLFISFDQNKIFKEKQRIQQVANEFCNERGFDVAVAYGKEQRNLRAINCYSTKEVCLKEICSKVIEKEQYFNPTDWQGET